MSGNISTSSSPQSTRRLLLVSSDGFIFMSVLFGMKPVFAGATDVRPDRFADILESRFRGWDRFLVSKVPHTSRRHDD